MSPSGGQDGLVRATERTEPSTSTATLGYDDRALTSTVTGFGSVAGTHQQSYDPAWRLASYTPPPVSGASAGTTSPAHHADGLLRPLRLPAGPDVALPPGPAGRGQDKPDPNTSKTTNPICRGRFTFDLTA